TGMCRHLYLWCQGRFGRLAARADPGRATGKRWVAGLASVRAGSKAWAVAAELSPGAAREWAPGRATAATAWALAFPTRRSVAVPEPEPREEGYRLSGHAAERSLRKRQKEQTRKVSKYGVS